MTGTFREPAFFHSLPLVEQFKNAPEKTEAGDTEKSGGNHAADEDGADETADAEQKKEPPWAHAEIVFCLYHNRMKHADDEKG